MSEQEERLATAGSAGAAATSPMMGGYKFSPEETRVLADCNRESFYQRSLPAGAALGFGTFYAMQGGYLRPSPRFGPFPKVTLAVVVGYFLGKLSYQQACAEKLMALPDSYIGQLLRERKEGRGGGAGAGAGRANAQPPTMFGAGPGDIYSDAGPGSALNIDTDRPLFTDDHPHPHPHPAQPHEGAGGLGEPPRAALSYDELRRRNRGELTRADPARSQLAAPAPPAAYAPAPAPAPRAPTNKYGDTME